MCPRFHCSIARTLNITPLSSPTMKASIILLLVACTAFAAADSCTEEDLLNINVCEADTVEAFEECATSQFYAVYTDCQNGDSAFAEKFMDCILPKLSAQKMAVCVEKKTVEETKDCADGMVQDAVNFC